MLLKIFFNVRENRIRSGWRLIMFVAIVAFSTAIVGLLSSLLFYGFQAIFPENSAVITQIFSLIFSTAGIVLGILITARWVDHRDLKSLGLGFSKKWWLDLLFGALLGILLMSMIFLIELAFGWIKISGYFTLQDKIASFTPVMVIYVIQFLCVGIYEELIFRSYLLTNLAEGLSFIRDRKTGLLIAYLLICAVFGIAHAFNPNASLTSVSTIMLAGLLLGLGYVLTGNIALSIGLHITWNFFQGNVFGFPVSGMPTNISFIGIQQLGNDIITGGAFGPEAGLIGVFAILLGMAAIFGWVKWRYGEINLGLLDNMVYMEELPKLVEEEDVSYPNLN